jgi:hypothetical protein
MIMRKTLFKTFIVLALMHFSMHTINAQEMTKALIEDKIAMLDQQQIHYLKMGSGPKTIVLLHGWPESSHMWRETMPKLIGNNEYTVIAPDHLSQAFLLAVTTPLS